MKSYIVDAFTDEKFKGNPAGVCFVEEKLDDKKMLEIAKEFGLSETAFLMKTEKNDIFNIRYFSPKKEIPLCGHATLASAKILFTISNIHKIHFITYENVDLLVENRNEEIVMSFPIYETIEVEVPKSMLEALGINYVINKVYSPKNKIIVLEIKDSDALADLTPNFEALLKSKDGINGVLVTAISINKDYDFQYRYFWPWAGTNEDPVTGGVQTFLAKYWSKKIGKTKLRAFQCSERTGFMNLELLSDKVLIMSKAVVIFEGELNL